MKRSEIQEKAMRYGVLYPFKTLGNIFIHVRDTEIQDTPQKEENYIYIYKRIISLLYCILEFCISVSKSRKLLIVNKLCGFLIVSSLHLRVSCSISRKMILL